jgi:hypothetical protein
LLKSLYSAGQIADAWMLQGWQKKQKFYSIIKPKSSPMVLYSAGQNCRRFDVAREAKKRKIFFIL